MNTLSRIWTFPFVTDDLVCGFRESNVVNAHESRESSDNLYTILKIMSIIHTLVEEYFIQFRIYVQHMFGTRMIF